MVCKYGDETTKWKAREMYSTALLRTIISYSATGTGRTDTYDHSAITAITS